MELGSIATVITVSLAVLGAIAGVFRFISTQVDSLRREILSVQQNGQLLVEKATESESRQRHSLANVIQVAQTKMELEIRSIQKETVRHEQMDALEIRLNTSLAKIEAKLEKLTEATAELISIRTQLGSVNSRLERISDRLDEQHGVAKNTRIA